MPTDTALATRPRTHVTSFGARHHTSSVVVPVEWTADALPLPDGTSVLPQGLARSYGDSCLNDGGTLLATRRLDRFLAFDAATGLLRAESGVQLFDLLRLVTPHGWFLPVTPGTKYVTLGGAIANDVHGKNHHVMGTFGRHVTRFELLRSDGSRRVCSASEHADLFGATIGGLGLTGLITWAEIQLRRIESSRMAVESFKLAHLTEFFDRNEESLDWEYTVSWMDCLARGASLGRGHFMRGRHAPAGSGALTEPWRHPKLVFPVVAPNFAMNPLTVQAFNFAYYHRQLRPFVASLQRFDPYFYPLDFVRDWQRVWGRRGFFQYQCVIPAPLAKEAGRAVLEAIVASREASFLVVVKMFGDVPSPGWLSFPRPGITIAIDFGDNGARTRNLFRTLDHIVEQAGGALYPAKDACMSAEHFQRAYPRWRDFASVKDPAFSSDFWRRVTGGGAS